MWETKCAGDELCCCVHRAPGSHLTCGPSCSIAPTVLLSVCQLGITHELGGGGCRWNTDWRSEESRQADNFCGGLDCVVSTLGCLITASNGNSVCNISFSTVAGDLLPRLSVSWKIGWNDGGGGDLTAACKSPVPAFISNKLRSYCYFLELVVSVACPLWFQR